MGAADIVPGVSGGTIAFITGIYERLLLALKSVIPAAYSLLKHKSFSKFWQQIDGFFLLTLLSGIILSVISLAKVITFLLAAYPIHIWSAFFGLIVASVYIVGRDIERWTPGNVLVLLFGVVIAYAITSATPASVELTMLNIFLSGVLAICAMVLPGISGSFILVILGTYAHVLASLKSFDLAVIGVFMLGCLVGILSIANALAWAFSKFRQQTLAILTGFMVGALNKVWPWKEVLSYRENRHGELVPLTERNVMPQEFELLSSEPSFLWGAVLCAVLAACTVVLISFLARKNENSPTKIV